MTKNKVGDRIGELELISFKENKWTVRCSCGEFWTVRTSRLIDRVSCPKCTPAKEFHHYKAGQVLFENILIERLPSRKWRMQCRCGNIRVGSPCDLERYKTCKRCHKPDEIGKKKRLPDNIALYRARMKYYQYHAGQRENKWELSESEFFQLINGPCHYCGEIGSMKETKKDRTISINGVDRVDNTQGYSIKNSVSCCNFCNHAKKDHEINYFLNKIKQIAEHISSETIPTGSTSKCLET